MAETDAGTSRWRPTHVEIGCYLLAGAAAIIAALSGASLDYVGSPGETPLFSVPAWATILIVSLGVYLIRVHFRRRTPVDDSADSFFDQE